MTATVQISAFISKSTKDLLERETRATGVKKGRLLEDALRHHLEALHAIPAEYIIPPVLVVSKRSAVAFAERMRHPKATPALRRLMRDGD